EGYYRNTVGRALASAEARRDLPPKQQESTPYRAYGAYGAPPDDANAGWPPAMDGAAYHGLAGEFVALVEPHTEADPAALLVQYLVMAGSVFGRGRYFAVEEDRHHTNLFATIVGESSKARKGTSKGRTLARFAAADACWAE